MALVEYYRSVTRVVITMAEPMKVFRDILRMIKDVDGERLARAVDNESAAPRFIEAFQSTSSEGPWVSTPISSMSTRAATCRAA